ncbi:Nrd1-like ribonucleoside reductase assembly flavoprotein [Bacillus phage YungSlug]|nr:Nrd1-like ribonucleoside reductase assembly flavoprotein [Bacillus phage YungSlug]
MTGNVKRFCEKLSFDCKNINELEKINEPFILVTYTTGFGKVPDEVKDFLNRIDTKYLIGVSASGNRNWGDMFAKSADTISQQYNIPILSKFELQGTNEDVEVFTKEVERVYESYRTK